MLDIKLVTVILLSRRAVLRGVLVSFRGVLVVIVLLLVLVVLSIVVLAISVVAVSVSIICSSHVSSDSTASGRQGTYCC